MKRQFRHLKGFTLLELLLVLAIMSGIMVMLLQFVTQRTTESRRDRTVLQIQQILNAGLSYYVNNGYWPTGEGSQGNLGQCEFPTTLRILEEGGYLPTGAYTLNPYNQPYNIRCDAVPGVFKVMTQFPEMDERIIAGRLPGSEIVDQEGAKVLYVSVTIPGQNLNNARAVNFADIYHPGGCVPAPKCPGTMTPQVFVVPAQVSGLNTQGSLNVSPINSFTAYAYGAAGTPPGTDPVLGGIDVASCSTPETGLTCVAGTQGGTIDANTKYWRVCLKVNTELGNITANWDKFSVLAITRCGPPNEPSGSDFTVFTPGG